MIIQLLHSLVGKPRWLKILIMVGVDSVTLAFSVWLSFALRLGDPWSIYIDRAPLIVPLIVAVTIPTFFTLGFYRSVLRYVSGRVFYDVARGVGIGTLLSLAVWAMARAPTIPRSTWIIHFVVAVLLIGIIRLIVRGFVSIPRGAFATGERVAIYGAGDGGAQLAVALQHSREFKPVAFIDDSMDLQSTEILGLRVYSPDRLPDLVPRLEIATVLLAIPSANQQRRREILAWLEELPVRVLAMPALTELASGVKRVDELREIDVEDVLGRDPIPPDPGLLTATVSDKCVLVTGAGGSIGSELCRQIVRLRPSHLLMFDISEYLLYTLDREMQDFAAATSSNIELVPILGTVNDPRRLASVMEAFAVQTVFHAAAYKHVPIVEHNPIEGVINNVLGTYHCAEAARRNAVETFVLVSTDKAVRPTNVMGASKRLAELVLQGLAQDETRTKFCMVRFGNVLASSGSVVPLFREQIRVGGPVTVTHPDIVRYFMTVTEAAQLVIQAGSLASGGEVFLLEMGEPVRIVDLARRMIHLSGFEVRDEHNPGGDIEIHYTGLRAGEKLFEELLIGDQDAPTPHPRILRAQEDSLRWAELEPLLVRLRKAVEDSDHGTVRSLLLESVSEYTPSSEIKDRVLLAQTGSESGGLPRRAEGGSAGG